MWLFHLHSAMKIRPFLRFSPWRDPRPRHFSGYPFGVSRKKASAIFRTQPTSSPVFSHGGRGARFPALFFRAARSGATQRLYAGRRESAPVRHPAGPWENVRLGQQGRIQSRRLHPRPAHSGAPHRARLTKEKRSCWICS